MSTCGAKDGEDNVSSLCSSKSSSFFIILGFTLLVLVLLLFFIVVVAFVKRKKIRSRAQALQNAQPGNRRAGDDCVIYVNGNGQIDGPLTGINMEGVKCVIMAGQEKPTFIAHPATRIFPASNHPPVTEGQKEVELQSQESAGKEGAEEGETDSAWGRNSGGERNEQRDVERAGGRENPTAAQPK